MYRSCLSLGVVNTIYTFSTATHDILNLLVRITPLNPCQHLGQCDVRREPLPARNQRLCITKNGVNSVF